MEKTGNLAQWPLLIPSILAELVRVRGWLQPQRVKWFLFCTLLHLWFGQPNATSGDLDL